MLYFIVFLFSIFIFNSSNKLIVKDNRYIILFAMWLLVLGLQYNVGTDYFSYIKLIHNSELILRKKEYLFYFILKLTSFLNIGDQFLFIIVSSLQIIFTFIFFRQIEKKNISILIILLLYFTLSGIFFNQMNILRQYLVLPLFSIALIYFQEKKYLRFIALIIVSSFFHQSSIIGFLFLPLLFLCKKIYSRKLYLLFMLLVFAISFVGIKDLLVFVISKLSPIYSHYIDSQFSERVSITRMLVKYLSLPLYVYSVYYSSKINDKRHIYLYNLGLLGISSFYIFSELTILLRVALYFNFFKIFPIYFLIIELKRNNKKLELMIVLMYIMGLFILKTVFFPAGEYIYSNIIFEETFYYLGVINE